MHNTNDRLCSVSYDCCGKQIEIIQHEPPNKIRTQKKCCKKKYIDTDVIVVGSGMAGTMAMLSADKENARVIMLESEPSLGGTTLQSGSTLWIPNLTKTKNMATAIKNLNIPLIGNEYNNLPGTFDLKEDALKYMSSSVYNELYNENDEYLGLPSNIYHLVESFYDNTAPMLENEILPYINALREQYNSTQSTNHYPMTYNTGMHSLTSGFTLTQNPDETFLAVADPPTTNTFGVIPGYCYSVDDEPGFFSMESDYFDKHNKQGTCVGRQITFYENTGTSFKSISGGGLYLKRIWKYLQTVRNQQILTNRRVVSVKEKEDGVMVKAINEATKETFYYKARKGIVFGSGGFSHNNELITKHLAFGNIYGTCSSNGCRGDLIGISEKNKWDLSQMKNAFFNQQTLNDIGTNTQSIQWFHWFSSLMVINKFGNRVYAETAKYNERARVHFAWDATNSYYNQYLFMVLDKSDYNRHKHGTLAYSKAFAIDNNEIPINEKIQMLCYNIKTWFQSLENLAEFNIDDSIMANGFINTLNKYHSYCQTGIDLDFSRQNNDSGRHWLGFSKFIGGQFITKNTQITQSNDWRLNETQVNSLYGPNGVSYFNTIANYPYTYPNDETLNVCPDITLQPIIDPVVLVLVPTTLDTKGGPLNDINMKIVNSKGSYVAGNAGGNAFTTSAYFGAGGTLGCALFSGWTAGKHVAKNNYCKSLDDKFGRNLNVIRFMDNSYPDKTISLDFNVPVSFVFASNVWKQGMQILFKLSKTINESIPKCKNTAIIDDWMKFHPTLINSSNCCHFIKIVLPSNIFSKGGKYLLSFQLTYNNKSLGPKYADQQLLSIIPFNNINNYSYLNNNLPNDSIVLLQEGAFWTGKNKLPTQTGFPEALNDKDIYLQYHQPSHNFNLTHGFQFDTLNDVMLFSNLVYSGENNQALDASAVLVQGASMFNFTFNPNPPPNPLPNVVIVANLDIGFYQPWFNAQYNVDNEEYAFPKNEVSNYAYITTSEVIKNWYFNKTLTQPGKYTAYFYYCRPHRTTSIHIGWFLVMP